MEYGRWLDEHQRLISDLRLAVNSHMGDNELCIFVGGVMAHYDEVFRLKSIGAKADIFHMLSGMWKTLADKCFMWLGGFRSSELMKQQVQDRARGQKREPFNRGKQNKQSGPQNFGNYTGTGWENQISSTLAPNAAAASLRLRRRRDEPQQGRSVFAGVRARVERIGSETCGGWRLLEAQSKHAARAFFLVN
ncbi:hypothetical protein Gotur_005143 [Gossypium turneri]